MSELEKHFQHTKISQDLNSQASIIVIDVAQTGQLSVQTSYSGLIIISGDSLLQWNDFSGQERAWLFLQRLSANHSSSPIAIQTYQPDQVIWNAWANFHDQRWYDIELQQRQRLQLPPWSRQWVLSRPVSALGPSRVSVVQRLRAYQPNIRIVVNRTIVMHRKRLDQIVIQFATNATHQVHLPWAEILVHPWQVDTHPISWSFRPS